MQPWCHVSELWGFGPPFLSHKSGCSLSWAHSRRSGSGQHTLAGSLGQSLISIHLEPVFPGALRGRLPAVRTSRSEFSAEACFQCWLLCSCWATARAVRDPRTSCLSLLVSLSKEARQ